LAVDFDRLHHEIWLARQRFERIEQVVPVVGLAGEEIDFDLLNGVYIVETLRSHARQEDADEDNREKKFFHKKKVRKWKEGLGPFYSAPPKSEPFFNNWRGELSAQPSLRKKFNAGWLKFAAEHGKTVSLPALCSPFFPTRIT
jgi:hypothetical protein